MMAKIVYEKSRADYGRFREMAVTSLLDAVFHEYLYLGCTVEEAETLKPSLELVLERWWNNQHTYRDPTTVSRSDLSPDVVDAMSKALAAGARTVKSRRPWCADQTIRPCTRSGGDARPNRARPKSSYAGQVLPQRQIARAAGKQNEG